MSARWRRTHPCVTPSKRAYAGVGDWLDKHPFYVRYSAEPAIYLYPCNCGAHHVTSHPRTSKGKWRQGSERL